MSHGTEHRQPMNRLHGKTALITGGAGAIGLAAARLVVQAGAQVVLVDLNEAALQEALQSIGNDRASSVVADAASALAAAIRWTVGCRQGKGHPASPRTP